MQRSARLILCLIATVLAFPALAQVAQVYISTTSAIYAYDAALNGRLTKVPGSPFSGGKNAFLGSMAVNGKYLFIVDGNGAGSVESNIDTWHMASNGALEKLGTTSVARRVPNFCCINSIQLDHTGQTLYVGVLGDAFLYLSFNIEKETGELNYTGQTAGYPYTQPLTFSADNLFAYGAICNSDYLVDYPRLLGYKRLDDGYLTQFSLAASFPLTRNSDGFCPTAIAAADPQGHVAFAFQELVQPGFYEPDGPPQLASYTADKEGNLSTTSTYLNMPTMEVGYVNNLNMSPSGKLLAVGGDAGLQVFHFNGGSPITGFTGLLNKNASAEGGVNVFSWDNNDHLYAVYPDGKLRVFTITPTSVVEAPGSPLTLPKDTGFTPALAVQILPRYKPF